MSVDRDTVRRLRDLHGVLERGLALAVDVICEHDSHGLSKKRWIDTLVQRGAADMQRDGVFGGRWSLFTDDEIRLLSVGVYAGRVESVIEEGSIVASELEIETMRRGLEPDTVVHDGVERRDGPEEA